METKELLRATVADFFEVDPGQLGPAFPLAGRLGQGSIARAALDSAIRRRVGLKSKAVYSANTYGELEAALLPASSDGAAAAPAPAPSPEISRPVSPPVPSDTEAAAAACGVDIELVNHLPAATDYWEHEFYTTHFTPREIAYCLTQESPRMHFAGRWCVKEALKKCDPALMAEEMKNIEFVGDEPGGPFLRHYVAGRAQRLPHAVSLAHTPSTAVAIVVKLHGAALPRAAQVPEQPVAVSAPPPVPEVSSRSTLGAWGLFIALLALGLSCLALWRAFHP